jgi:hypothetical protein
MNERGDIKIQGMKAAAMRDEQIPFIIPHPSSFIPFL